MASAIRSAAPAPSPVDPGAGRATRRGRHDEGRPLSLPADPGRATELLYKHHGDTVLRYAWHLLGRREDAEDATQATFLAVHGALANGTAVLQPGAWVLSIARNECMGRLRRQAQGPAVGLLDSDVPAAGGVERAAELRDEMRTAHHTLSLLPEPQREAFLLREWIGLPTGEVAVALGLTTPEVEMLAVRARRTLMLAVGGLEPAVGCAATRAGLEAGSLGRAGKVHLLRCPVCRGVRRALRAPDAAARSRLASAGVAGRLAAVLPGFGLGGSGIVATLTAKTAAAPLLTKTVAAVAAAVMTGGVAAETIRSTLPAHHGSHGGKSQAVALASPARVRHTASASAGAREIAHTIAARPAAVTVTRRGGVARTAGLGAAVSSRGGHSDGGASSRGRGDGSGSGSSGHGDGNRHGEGGDSSGSGENASESHSGSGKAIDSGGDRASASSHGGDSGDGDSSGSGDGKQLAATVEPVTSGKGSDGGGGDSSGSGDSSAVAPADQSGSGGGDQSGDAASSSSGSD